MAKKLNRQQTEAKINVKAWKDPSFRKKLLDAPHEALKEMGMAKIPSGLEIQTAEEGKNQWVIRLYNRPLNFKKLSEEALEKIASGKLQETKCCKSPA